MFRERERIRNGMLVELANLPDNKQTLWSDSSVKDQCSMIYVINSHMQRYEGLSVQCTVTKHHHSTFRSYVYVICDYNSYRARSLSTEPTHYRHDYRGAMC